MSKKTQCLSSGTYRAREREKAKVIAELRLKYPLKDLINFLEIARSTYHYYLKEKQDKYEVEKQEILNIFTSSKNTYGYRRITLELRQKGYVNNHKTVLKLMKMLKIYGKQRKSKYKSYRGEVGKVAPNILNREFNANAPYTKLTTDVTEFNVCNENVYLSPY